MRPHRRPARLRALAATCLATAGLVVAGLAPASAAGPAPAAVAQATSGDDTITFVGHGWGHGRGMGQYGALGYAVDYGKSYSWILDHFYQGTVAGNLGNPEMTVELLGLTGKPLVVTGAHVYVHPAGSTTMTDLGTAARFTVLANGFVKVEKASSCAPEATGGSWQLVSDNVFTTNNTRVAPQAGASAVPELLRVCEASDERAYRGELSVVGAATSQMTINHLPTESYLQGVVPRESPASWASLGGGKGAEALKAQAVAARSYALSSSRSSGAKTCDTTSCQVYGGAALLRGSTWEYLEDARTNAAIAATAGQVRVTPGTSTPVRTEFSSSTGGWTAGGTFGYVEDLGDAISSNPNHVWTTTLTSSQIASRLGLPGVRLVTVTQRNGYGDWGGRVLKVSVVDTNGVAKDFSGAAFRTAMGTSTFKSDWFAIASLQRAQAEAVVKALYADLLGRGVDPTGLEWWSTRLMTGTSQSELVRFLTGSDEYIDKRITAAYREVLGRAPEAAGLAWWHDAIVHGRATVDDVKRRFYDSQEYYARAGGTDAGYVSLLYRTMLDRNGSSSEVAYWSSMIPKIGRGGVVDTIWFSMEAAVFRAGGYYRVFLQRAPDRAGQEYWGTVLLTSGEGAVRIGIAGSPEYAQLALSRFP